MLRDERDALPSARTAGVSDRQAQWFLIAVVVLGAVLRLYRLGSKRQFVYVQAENYTCRTMKAN